MELISAYKKFDIATPYCYWFLEMNIPVPCNYAYIVTHHNIGSRLLSYKFVVCSIGYRVSPKYLTKFTTSLYECFSFNYRIEKIIDAKTDQ